MGKVERKLLLAYVNNVRPITRYDKQLHKDFFYFKMIMEEEFDLRPDLYFELIDEKKGKTEFKNEPYCHGLEMLVFKLLEEGKFEYVEAGLIDISKEGYKELVELRKVVDPIAPSVRYMITRFDDDKYHQKYRLKIKQMKEKKEPY
ncbi:MAG: hypothetical protein GX088_00700 [Clostridia bacterium]|nr:hypothetical protein [Clostridia bacterium]